MTTLQEEKNTRNATIKKLKNKVGHYSSYIKKRDMSSIESKMYILICQEEYDYNNYDTSILFSLFIYLTKLTKNKDIILNVCELYKTHKRVIDSLDDYLDMIYNIRERNIIYSILLKFDILPYIEKYYDSSIKHIIESTKRIKSGSKYYSLEKLNQYNETICDFKGKLEELIKKLLLYNFETTINATKIIEALSNKVNNTYTCFNKFNKAELTIYNKLIDIQLENTSILYVFNHFTIPIKRNGIHHLYADFLIVFNINDNYQFAIIEYDGPTHYNIKDNRITKNHIYCDIVKNNFCIRNSIHILRINDYDKNYLSKIYKFINDINKNVDIVTIIPPFEFYSKLLETII
jgi:hypothetical protein